MDARTISAGLSVSPQITKADIAALSGKGFRTVICNRPDGEEPGQPAYAEIEAAAAAEGMTPAIFPLRPGSSTTPTPPPSAGCWASCPAPFSPIAAAARAPRCSGRWPWPR
jgi:uncharacterized protein (TIGR01244 family)